jgi:hypothetical protein
VGVRGCQRVGSGRGAWPDRRAALGDHNPDAVATGGGDIDARCGHALDKGKRWQTRGPRPQCRV